MIQTLAEVLERIKELETENEGVISRRTAYRYKAYYDELEKSRGAGEWERIERNTTYAVKQKPKMVYF